MENEVKVLVPGDSWDVLVTEAGLQGEGEPQQVWFFDTADRQLLANGVVLRARVGARFDTTVKLRAVGGDPLPDAVAALVDRDGAKDENDCTADVCTRAVSLKAKLKVSETPKRLAWFTAAQLGLLDAGGVSVPWGELRRFGPIRSAVYEDVRPALDVTRWEIEGEVLVEVSSRAEGDWKQAYADLVAQLAAWKLPTAGLPGGKTAWALERLDGTPER